MSTAERVLMQSLYVAGIAVVVISSLAAMRRQPVYSRLHFLTPVTTLGGPLIGLALAIENGWSLTTGLVLFTVFLIALSGPVLESATGRVAAQREGLIEQESPQ